MNIDRKSVSTLSAEAANAPLLFDPKERGAFVRVHVQQIKKIVAEKRHTIDDIKSIFPEFCEQYPSLLEMLTRPGGYDEKSLSLMLNMLDQMGVGKATQHTASIKVGQHLLDSYVSPQVDSKEK
jgi:hypothetical protein